jgi:AraC-like DNA-binding protein
MIRFLMTGNGWFPLLLAGMILPLCALAEPERLPRIEAHLKRELVVGLLSAIASSLLSWFWFRVRFSARQKNLPEKPGIGPVQNDDLPVLVHGQGDLLSDSLTPDALVQQEWRFCKIPSGLDAAFLTKLEKVLNQQLDNPGYSIDMLCTEIGQSHSCLHRKLVSITGCGAHRYFRYLRLKKARELLVTTRMSISEISYLTGFTEPAYFIKVFFQWFGQTPGKWRKENKLA